MCGTCGCSTPADHEHEHGHDHEHEPDREIIDIERSLLAHNDRLAGGNRRWLEQRGIFAVNLIGAPGAGKTALLERAFGALTPRVPMAVLEGDQETDNDAARLRALGCPVRQINTGTVCHLDAQMVASHFEALKLPSPSLLAIENVGNLVCPSMFDLGEHAKIVVMSVTEGEDKPLKYPHVFRASRQLVLTKTDLLPHLDFDVEQCLANARRVNPSLDAFWVSARTSDGIGEWCQWLATAAARLTQDPGR